ncbi:hypothetical protein IGI04_020323 [Brassica rapa subsp. trilocularis]|uniref:Histidine-containing phosphotransfer protein n=1 Tax=Brassica rapa subsp. trilocularis TaxID=1813537 RepID=A0ABQ7MIE8_BRACM|nr:hypothetical protein IGI04_020323 [Brassica rapa subsp. trilocularis]
MQRQVALIKQSLFDQGFLDEQFMELEELQDDVNPNFVEEVATLYFKDSARLINSIDQALIGASKVKTECTMFREYCRVGNAEGWQDRRGLRRQHVGPSKRERHLRNRQRFLY